MSIIDRQKVIMQKWASNISRWIGSTASVTVHTIVFLISFMMPVLGMVSFDRMLLVLTTIVSLEAIYLSIFIQMSINMNNQNIEIIQEDIEELGEDIEEMSEDIEEISEDIEEISGDIEEIGEDIEELGEDIEEMSEDIEEIQKDVDEMQDDEEEPAEEPTIQENSAETKETEILRSIQATLMHLQKEIEELKRAGNSNSK